MKHAGTRFFILAWGITALIATMAFVRSPSPGNPVTVLQFRHSVGNKPLQLFDEVYANRFNEPFSVTKFRYYISHISIVDTSNKRIVLPVSYHLVNEADSLSK